MPGGKTLQPAGCTQQHGAAGTLINPHIARQKLLLLLEPASGGQQQEVFPIAGVP